MPPQILPLPPGTPLLPNTEDDDSASEVSPLISASFEWTRTHDLPLLFGGLQVRRLYARVFPPEASIPTSSPNTCRSTSSDFKVTALAGPAARERRRVPYGVRRSAGAHGQPHARRPVHRERRPAEIDGCELEVAAHTRAAGWRSRLGVGYLDPQYKEIEDGALEMSRTTYSARISEWTLKPQFPKDHRFGGWRADAACRLVYRSKLLQRRGKHARTRDEGPATSEPAPERGSGP